MDEQRKEGDRGLYIMMLSIHGLVRGENPELGRDPDTGGQVTYVLDLARALSEYDEVDRVDLVTRRIFDPKVDDIYSQYEERIAEKSYIMRFPFGPRRYLRKEVLWPHLDALVDRIVKYIGERGRVPDVVHGHYSDAGYVCAQLSQLLGVPMIFTGHSLGRVKKERLLKRGRKEETIEKKYNITRRIEGEEIALENADSIVASTRQEVEEQYARYLNYYPKRMEVIPPGVDLSRFKPPGRPRPRPPYLKELRRFLQEHRKPMVLAISRADERKNIPTLINAFAKNEELREKANLVIIAGNRETFTELEPGARKVIWEILRLTDVHDLYGIFAYPKHHQTSDVPDLYRIAASTHGVFVNPALTEPFGMTLLEAAASGLPVVATNDGGPQDILYNCKNGKLVDPLNEEEISAAILEIIDNRRKWRNNSRNGLRGVERHYSWKSHAGKYLKLVKTGLKKAETKKVRLPKRSKLPIVDRLLICDIDNTLVGDRESLDELLEIIESHRDRLGFGIATGRRIESAVEELDKWDVPMPDILITSVGSEIHYGKQDTQDDNWQKHLNYRWEPEKIIKLMDGIEGIEKQPESEQRRYKISYQVKDDTAPGKLKIVRRLRNNDIHARVIHSHGQYIDILPVRASKGLAVRYIALKWGINSERILVAGDSGNDAEMLRIGAFGVVVGNHSPELNYLKGRDRIYFAEREYAGGIVEAIEVFNFFKEKPGRVTDAD